jgi:hypothetical protein
MSASPSHLSAFDLTVRLIWQRISIPDANQAMHSCDEKQFYLSIPDIARFLVLPEDNCILIDKARDDIPVHMLNTWLLGTVMAYMLQYHGYLVLHGSAMFMNEGAVIFSGQSGAGKSTLASAFTQQGYAFITDDLVVIQQNHAGQYCVLPGPAKLKLWKDAMLHFNHEMIASSQVSLKTDKYAIPVDHYCSESLIPIRAFYELNLDQEAKRYHCDRLNSAQSLKILMQNAYRYFMLKPLGKLQAFFYDCHGLSQQIAVHQLTRTLCFHDIPNIIQHIELNQGIK